jgi:hypothetical protein
MAHAMLNLETLTKLVTVLGLIVSGKTGVLEAEGTSHSLGKVRVLSSRIT